MTPPLISVVITTYNYGRFLEECIDSVLAQDYPAELIDIVVVDDGSADDTPERVKKYEARYPKKVRYFRQQNRGQAAALNLGFANARGEIIALLDADDYFLPGKLARLAGAFQRDPALGMVYHPFLEFDMDTKETRKSKFALVSGSLFDDPPKFAWYVGQGTCVSFQRKFLDRLLPIPEELRMIADSYLGTLIVFVAPILALPEPLSAYRFHGGNAYHDDESQLSIEARKKRFQLWKISVAAMRKWLDTNGYRTSDPAVRWFHNRWILQLQTESFLIEPPGRFRFFKFILSENRAQSYNQDWKLTLYNYLIAPAALVFGFKNRRRMYEWRANTMTALQSLLTNGRGHAAAK